MKTINLAIKAAGCDTTCMHCWANGGRYTNMPYNDLERVVHLFSNYCKTNNYKFSFYTMHELLAHPDAVRILQLEGQESSNVMPTSGIPIAIRDDYKDLFDTLLKLGQNILCFSLHGIGNTHDMAVGRKGAFEELKIAMERAKAAGLQYIFNVFLTKQNINQFMEMKDFLHKAGIDKAMVCIAKYCPVKRSRKYDEIRVEYSDLIPLQNELKELDSLNGFENIEEYTEAAHYRKAVNEVNTDLNFLLNKSPDFIPVICDTDLKIYNGGVDAFGKCYGSLKDNAETVFTNLDDDIIYERTEYWHSPALFYPNETIPPLNVLAEKYADKNGQKLYQKGIYYKWLDRAFNKI